MQREYQIRIGRKNLSIYKTFTFVAANCSAGPDQRGIMALILKKDVVE
jgi:hypothetical protein